MDAGAALKLSLGYATGRGLREALTAAGFSGRRLRDSGLFTERGAERFTGMAQSPIWPTGGYGG